VATYRVVELYENLSDVREALRVELPHLRLDARPELMSAEQRQQAAAMLQAALSRLAPATVEASAREDPAPTEETPASKQATLIERTGG
jgi:hypothetical protein